MNTQLIKEREFLNFNQCLNENNSSKRSFIKEFYKNKEILINDFLSKGILFYGFTLNFSDGALDANVLWKMIHIRVEELLLISKNIELIEFMYVSIECHGERQEEREKLLITQEGSTQNNIENLRNNKNINLYERILDISKAEQKTLKGLPHLHGIIGIRSLIGENNILLNELNKFYLNNYYKDLLIKRLKTFKQINSYWNYVIKEHNFKFHRFARYSKFFDGVYNNFYDLELKFDHETGDPKEVYSLDLIENGLWNNLLGIGSKNCIKKRILIYLLNIYLWNNNIILNNNDFYKKLDETKFSWKLLTGINYLRDNMFELIKYLKNIFPQQLDNIDLNELFIQHLEDCINSILINNKYLPNLTFTSSLIEFKEGLYFFNYNYFFDYDDQKNNIKKLNVNSYKYFNKTYKYCSENKPIKWLNLLSKNFVKENPDEIDYEKLDEFCANLGRYFNSLVINNSKQKTICIQGFSNTGKSTLIMHLIMKAIGINNIGLVSNYGGQFAFEQIEDKQIIICDEFKYYTNNRSDLLKLIDNEPILLDKKGIQKKEFIHKGSVIFAFNPDINNKMLEDKAFINRLLIYTFTAEINDIDIDIKNILDEELPQIMLYCNKLFFKKLNEKKSHQKRHSKKLSNLILKICSKNN
jgi:hypothetical protein